MRAEALVDEKLLQAPSQVIRERRGAEDWLGTFCLSDMNNE
jgi:hypothetical protein